MMVLKNNVSLRTALDVIDKNAKGIVFFKEEKKIIGCLSDGDIRRLLLNGTDLDDNVKEHIKTDFFYFKSSDNFANRDWSGLKRKGIKLVPILNNKQELVEFYDLFFDKFIPILEPDLSGNEQKYLLDCIESGWISSKGKYVGQFEQEFSKLHLNRHATSTTNGTSALELALLSIGIEKGDEVIVPNVTFAASINAVINIGATPVICDIENKSWCIDISKIEKLITKKTKALMPVHLYGNACNMEQISNIACKYNLKVVEDCAESIGTKFNNIPVGTFGDASTFSFFGNKTITTGEGGMILFKDESHFNKAQLLKNHGMTEKNRYWHEVVGNNYRLTNMQAAIGLAQLERIDQIIDKKRKLASVYSEVLKDLSQIEMLPEEHNQKFHSNWLYTVVFEKIEFKDQIKRFLESINIDTRPMFYPLSDMPIYKKYHCGDISISQSISYRGLSLPSSYSLGEDEAESIAKNIKQFFKKEKR